MGFTEEEYRVLAFVVVKSYKHHTGFSGDLPTPPPQMCRSLELVCRTVYRDIVLLLMPSGA